jgi:hypothetical protein
LDERITTAPLPSKINNGHFLDGQRHVEVPGAAENRWISAVLTKENPCDTIQAVGCHTQGGTSKEQDLSRCGLVSQDAWRVIAAQ